MVLLSILLLNVAAYPIANFMAGPDPVVIEKCTNESKEDQEEAIDKNDKKLLSWQILLADQGHLLWTNYLPNHIYFIKVQTGNGPLKAVPTPPPDHFV